MGKKKKRRYPKRKAERAERLLRLPPELDAAIIAIAEQQGVSITETIVMLLQAALTAQQQLKTPAAFEEAFVEGQSTPSAVSDAMSDAPSSHRPP